MASIQETTQIIKQIVTEYLEPEENEVFEDTLAFEPNANDAYQDVSSEIILEPVEEIKAKNKANKAIASIDTKSVKSESKAIDENANQIDSIKVDESNKAAKATATADKSPASDQKANEKNSTIKKTADKKSAEKKSVDKKSMEKKSVEKKSVESKVSDKSKSNASKATDVKSDANDKENQDANKLKSSKMTLEECLEEGRQLMIKFVDNNFAEVVQKLNEQPDRSMIHRLGVAAVCFFDSILSMDHEKMAHALISMREAAEFADARRRKFGYINYLFTPDYDGYSDEECHAELCYAIAQLISGLLTVLEDQSVYGFVNGGLKIRTAYASFRECSIIFRSKVSWNSDAARMHFESGTRLGIGAFDLIISFFPSKLAKLLEYIGFNSDRDLAIEELSRAVKLVDSLHYDISSILLCAYYGFLEYFYGLGESGTDFFDTSAKIWARRTPNSSVVKLGFGIREMIAGKPDAAIAYFHQCIKGQSFWIQLHYACYWEICWAYAMKCEWDNAAKYAAILKDKCKWSPAMFTYLHAVFLFMDMEKNNKKELAATISDELKKIPKLKRKLGGKRAFHEKIVIDRSKKFHDKLDQLMLPPFELLYIWNMFHMMAHEPKLLMPMLEEVESKLKTIPAKSDSSSNLDRYCYLIFMKAVINRHLKNQVLALELFDEVLACKKKIKEETHLLPQSCFEIGMIYREMGKLNDSKRWLKRARDDYSDYLTESMIQYRVQWALDLIKKSD